MTAADRDAAFREAQAVEIVARVEALVDEMEAWEWRAPVGPGNASYANGYENGRRSVGADLRAALRPEGGPR